MNGAQSLIGTLVRSDVEVCFTNPGTSGMHFVAALDHEPDMRAVLVLFEGVATGPPTVMRVCRQTGGKFVASGPRLANGLANLHNAKKARSPVVNIIGDHATYHQLLEAPLTSDVKAFAAPVSQWIKSSPNGAEVGHDAAAAVRAANSNGGQIALLYCRRIRLGHPHMIMASIASPHLRKYPQPPPSKKFRLCSQTAKKHPS